MLEEKKSFIFSIVLVFLTLLVVFVLPFGIHFDLGPGSNSLVSLLWEIPFSTHFYSLRFFSAFQFYFEYCFFRLFFLLEIPLFYFGKFNKKRMLLISLISELIPLVLSIPALFTLNSQGENLNPIILPIPLLLVFALLLIWYIPRSV